MNLSAKRWLRHIGAVVAFVLVLGGGWAGYLRMSGNFHPIEDGVIYRSGQLSGAQFTRHIQEDGIRTIINFRGANVGRSWYEEEIKASNAAGVLHIDFPLSSGRELTDDEVVKLTALLRESPRPFLIHCEAGADRSGLASALYKLLVANRPLEEASAQLSFRYGHFPWLRSSTAAMDRTFDRVVSRAPTARQVN